MRKPKINRYVFVYADWEGVNGPILIGILHAELLRRKEIFSFEYNYEWLKSEHVQLLDPDLQLYFGMQYLNNDDKINFGMFLDSSPDRWGRVLMLRREAAIARKEQRPKAHLFEIDYLLGAYDGHRLVVYDSNLIPKVRF